MTKAMVITLGTGRNVENGIVRSIQTNNPDRLYFIATQESLITIAKIEAVIGHKLAYEKVYLVEDSEDVEECWKTANQAIRSLIQGGCDPGEICLDFTSGTKAMSAGAVLAGISLECSNLSYVGSGKRDAEGRAISGTERVITLTPNEVFIDSRRRLIQEFFNTFQYGACFRLIADARAKTMEQGVQCEFMQLENLVYAYSWWDRFDHQQAASYFRHLPRTFHGNWHIDTSQSKEMVSRIARQREQYAATGEIKNKYSEEILADLLVNADRRAQEGKYDDAVARLYRAVELIAQILLARRHIDTSEVKVEDLPTDWREAVEPAGEPMKLGQEKAFALLESLGEKIGREYRENEKLRHYLSKRNSSILAHQLEPMTREIYEGLSSEVNQLAERGFPGLNSLKAKSCFPLLELS